MMKMKHIYEQGTNGKTLILLHGTGGNEYDLIPIGKHIDHEANILSIRGNVSEYGMPRFFKRLAMGVFDMESLYEETENLYAFIKTSAHDYGFSLSDTTVIGYSNGANIATSVMMLNDKPFGHAMLFRPMVPLRKDEISTLDHVDILICSGTLDQTVPKGDPDDLKHILEKGLAKVTLKWINHGHQLTAEEIEDAKRWYQGLDHQTL